MTTEQFTRFGVHAAMGIMLVSAVGKLLDLPFFAERLTLFNVPTDAALVVATFIAYVELTLSAAWFLVIGRQVVVVSAIFLVAVFSVVLLRHLPQLDAHGCSCLGVLERTMLGRVIAGNALFRNGLILVALFAWTFTAMRRKT